MRIQPLVKNAGTIIRDVASVNSRISSIQFLVISGAAGVVGHPSVIADEISPPLCLFAILRLGPGIINEGNVRSIYDALTEILIPSCCGGADKLQRSSASFLWICGISGFRKVCRSCRW